MKTPGTHLALQQKATSLLATCALALAATTSAHASITVTTTVPVLRPGSPLVVERLVINAS